MKATTKPKRRGLVYRPRYRKGPNAAWSIVRGFATIVCSVLSVLMTVQYLQVVFEGSSTTASGGTGSSTNVAIMDRFDTYVTNNVSTSLEGLEGAVVIKKSYWLSDEDLIAPEPNPENYGTTTNPADLIPVLEEAKKLLDVEDTLFSPDVKLFPDSEITYYLDETILVITWKETVHGAAYTFSEVKIAHPSQFRRFLAEGRYGSDKQYVTTEMAASVNAVTASSGDFYKFRSNGVRVYKGKVYQADGSVDTCYINEDGNLLFTHRGEIDNVADAEKFVEENKVRFSLAFGPILVENGEVVETKSYPIGEIFNQYSRAGLGQLGELHYLMVTANLVPGAGVTTPTMKQFAEQMHAFGCEMAYSLDGGQTAVIVTGDKLINRPDWGWQRQISDIIYFATALPEEE